MRFFQFNEILIVEVKTGKW